MFRSETQYFQPHHGRCSFVILATMFGVCETDPVWQEWNEGNENFMQVKCEKPHDEETMALSSCWPTGQLATQTQ